jgi:hypothetical protein
MSDSARPANLPAGVVDTEHDRYLPAWNVADMPAPPRFNFRNVIAIVGPGAIALSMSIGSGEWLAGPAATIQYGAALLWITSLAVIGQTILNTEACRYTLYTGEPIYTGYLRTFPGPRFWSIVYTILAVLQWGWPGWAATSATALAAIWLGRMPGNDDRSVVLVFAYIGFLLCVAVLSVGGKVERGLELASFAIVLWIFAFLIVVALAFVPLPQWGRVASGFLQVGSLPSGADWFLLSGFAAYSGAGGLGNTTISNWMRDKGYGMGGVVGAIPALVGGRHISLSHTGTVPPTTPENLARFKAWWKYLRVDQYILWAGGCFVGMFLCVLLAVTFVPAGTTISGFAVAAYQAEGLAKVGGNLLWTLTLLNGFWILWGTQLSITDGFVRTVTDMLWSGNKAVRNWRGGNVGYVYYTILIAFAVWGCIAMNLAQPFVLILLGANAAGLAFLFLTAHTVYVNRKFLPKELQPPLWREIGMLLFWLFTAFFVFQVAYYQLHTQLKWI